MASPLWPPPTTTAVVVRTVIGASRRSGHEVRDADGRDGQQLDELIWSPDSGLAEPQVEQFVLLARSVGTLARALDCSSAVRQPSVVMSAAAASRDVTLFHALRLLHESNYELAKAMCTLAPNSGPLLCRDEMEEWSASEGNLFEEAMDKYGKDFHDLRNDFLPWKTLKAIVEYYYMWKTTDRYVQQKRIKAAEAERKLKQVYIPNYNKPNPAVLYNKPDANGRGCESCYATASNQWYAWGPPHMQCRLCANCWTYWKKYGGLKMPTRLGELPSFYTNFLSCGLVSCLRLTCAHFYLLFLNCLFFSFLTFV